MILYVFTWYLKTLTTNKICSKLGLLPCTGHFAWLIFNASSRFKKKKLYKLILRWIYFFYGLEQKRLSGFCQQFPVNSSDPWKWFERSERNKMSKVAAAVGDLVNTWHHLSVMQAFILIPSRLRSGCIWPTKPMVASADFLRVEMCEKLDEQLLDGSLVEVDGSTCRTE